MFFNHFHLMEFLISILQKLSSCFLGCFGIKDKQLDQTPHTPLLSDDSITNHIIEEEDAYDWRSNSSLATLFQDKVSAEKECEPMEESTEVPLEYSVDQELKDELRFLTACGALMDAPSGSSEVFNELEWQEQSDEAPGTAARRCETMEIDADSPEHSSLTYMDEEELADEEGNGSRSPLAATGATHPIDDNMYAVTPVLPSTATHKVVHFEGHIDGGSFSLRSSLPQSGDDMLDKSDAFGCHSALCRSSYPTPLSINDNMETPGTIYLSCENSFASGKRIRTQYVRSILKPDNFSQWDTQKKEDTNSQQQHQQHGQVIRSVKQQENENPEFYTVSQTVFDGELRSKASDMDKTIIGLAPSQWSYDEPFHIPDKVMIANGIPNSSRKYKEDQKISWHATPFEERLEKALSWEAHISQRKILSGRPIDFDEN